MRAECYASLIKKYACNNYIMPGRLVLPALPGFGVLLRTMLVECTYKVVGNEFRRSAFDVVTL